MSDTPRDPDSPTPSLLSRYLRQLEAGEALEADGSARELVENLFESQSLQQRVATRYGPDADPGIALQDDSGSECEGGEETLDDQSRYAITFKRYQRRGEVARGGMGVILRVWDRSIRRNLAMKVILDAERVTEGEQAQRFLEEAQITGQLEHPGIVPVHELGLDDDGRLYFTMSLVKGRDLSRVFDMVAAGRGGWTVTRALGLLLKACEAIAYAHSKGVIHRDLKPANIMVGRFGQVYVMDWGLAKVIDSSRRPSRGSEPTLDKTAYVSVGGGSVDREGARPLSTVAGTVLGTPAYMPPEQALGRVDKIGRYSDVYSVGAILYHLLTGQPPYLPPGSRANADELIARVCNTRPRRIQRINPEASPELVAICEKAMARRPRDRYRNMARMTEDLRAYLEGRVVRAYRTGTLADFSKWVLRNRGTAAAILSAVVVAFGGLSAVSVVQARSRSALESQNRELEAAVTEAEKTRSELEQKEQRLSTAVAQLEVLREAAEEATGRVRREADKAEAVLGFMVELFRPQDPTASLRPGVTARELLQAAQTRLDEGAIPDDETRSRVVVQLIRAFHDIDEYDLAEGLVAGALRASRGEEEAELLGYLVNRARLLTETGARPADAVYLWTVLVDEYSLRGGEEQYRTLACRAGRASVNLRSGAVEEAKQELEEVLRIADGSRSMKMAWTNQARFDLAVACEQLGSHDRARALYTEVLDQLKLLSGNDRVVLRLKEGVAVYCTRAGRLERAEQLYREILEGWLEVYAGYERPTYVRVLSCTAKLTGLLQKLESADAATLDVITRVVAVLVKCESVDPRTVDLAQSLVEHTPMNDSGLHQRQKLLESARRRAKRR